MNDIIRSITILASSENEKLDIGRQIHEQLVGNKDYIDNNIVLNIDEPLTVHLWIFKECTNIPTIQI